MSKQEQDKTIKDWERIADRLEHSGVSELVKLSQKTWRILGLNFVIGIARGLGFTIGTALVLAVAYQIVSHLISMNIPYITEALKGLIEVIQSNGVSTSLK